MLSRWSKLFLLLLLLLHLLLLLLLFERSSARKQGRVEHRGDCNERRLKVSSSEDSGGSDRRRRLFWRVWTRQTVEQGGFAAANRAIRG